MFFYKPLFIRVLNRYQQIPEYTSDVEYASGTGARDAIIALHRLFLQFRVNRMA
jgi:hypothetical protein